MTDLLDLAFPRELLAHAGFLLIALAFIVRDALVLHSRAIVAYCFFIGFASLATGGPAWHLIVWYLLFLGINGWQVARLLHERHFDRLTDDEERLMALAFPALDKCAAKRLMRRGRWVDLAPGTRLTLQKQLSDDLFLLLEGEAEIWLDGSRVCGLGPGQFVGEIGFVAKAPATATAIAGSTGVRALAWDQATLRRDAARNGALDAAIHTALGADLARKIADQTLDVIRNRDHGDRDLAA